MDQKDKLANEIQKQLSGKVVSKIHHPNQNDFCVEFTDGTRLFVTAPSHSELDFSISGGDNE